MKRLSHLPHLTAIVVMLPVLASAADLCNSTNTDGVQNPTSARNMVCSFASGVHVTQIVTYHWNNGRGKLPGTLGLKNDATGKVYGPFSAVGSAGQGGAPNVNWAANVNLCLPAGNYSVLDSDGATWSVNAKSGYRGFAILRGDYGKCLANPGTPAAPSGKPAPVPVNNPPKTTPPSPKPATPPPPLNLTPGKKQSINCFLNSGAAAPKTTPCKGPAGTVLGVYLPTTQNYTTMVFKAYGFPDQTAPLQGSGPIRSAAAPQSLCVFNSGNVSTATGLKPPNPPPAAIWSVYVTGSGVPPIGPVGGFSITDCGGKLPSTLPASQPFPGGNPPPGLNSIPPCYVNSYAIASSGPCFGPPGSMIAVRIYNQKRGPFSILVFKNVVASGVPALVTAPLVGTGNLLMATAPPQLCLAKFPNNKWQVWLAGPTKSLGQIGDFSITGCSGATPTPAPQPQPAPAPARPPAPLIGNIRVIPGGGNHPECAAAGNSLLTVNVQGSNFDAGAHIIVSFIYFVDHNKFRTDYHGKDSRVAATMIAQNPTFLSGTISLPTIHQTGGDPFGLGGNYYVQVQNGDGQVNPRSPNYFTVPPYNGADSRCR